MSRILFAALFWAIPALTAQSQEITGRAVAYDTDKIAVGDQRILLYGIDSLDKGQQTCYIDRQRWGCYAVALRTLQILVDDGPVTCREVDEHDLYGRTWAVCVIEGRDVAETMVRAGWAFAYRPQTDRYVADEEEAKAEGVGLWQSEFLLPWEWRKNVDMDEADR